MDKKILMAGGALALFFLLKPNKAAATTGGGTSTNGGGVSGNGFTPTAGTHGSLNESFLGITPVHGNRGIRNNNPTNIKYNANNNWLGKVPYNQNTDTNAGTGAIEKIFEQYTAYPYGVRAAIYLLKNRYINQGDNTPLKILNKWANNPDASYPNYVASQLGVGVNDVVSADYATLKKLVQAIARFENGRTAPNLPETVTDLQFETAFYGVNQL